MWNPWKFATIGLSAMVATALVTGLVVAGWNARSTDREPPPATSSAAGPGAPSAAGSSPGVPMQTSIADCNQVAAAEVGGHDKTGEVVKDSVVGALIGAAVGAAGGAAAGGGKGAGKGAAIGGAVGAGGGSLYGLNENKKHDEAYRAAYARCMASRGYRS